MRFIIVLLLFGLVSAFSGCIREEAQTTEGTTPEAGTPTTEEATPSTTAEPSIPSTTAEPAVVPPTVEPGTVPTAAISEIAPLTDATVEVGCAKCVYKMEGVESCALAVKVGDETMLVEGEGLQSTEELGVCEAAKSAVVSGKVEEGKFIASKVEVQ